MAEARALFKRHVKSFFECWKASGLNEETAAILYGACILAESVSRDMEDQDFRIINPNGNGDGENIGA